MPELAEVEYYRKRWDEGLDKPVATVEVRALKRVYREAVSVRYARSLAGATMESSRAAGKQMLFGFSGGLWLAIHLGMTGKLRAGASNEAAGPHDHLVLRFSNRALFFSDPRQFGRVRCEKSAEIPDWWTSLPPSVLSKAFSAAALIAFLGRRRRASLKAVLLMQERFPGIGNWMADEILWRSRINPKRLCGSITGAEAQTLWRNVRNVSRNSLRIIGTDFTDPPDSWLFPHRWKNGGNCPRDCSALRREEIGGRTTCWCEVCQPEKA